jgi:peptidoglycan/LPS O-acetylase OafA/YrhL
VLWTLAVEMKLALALPLLFWLVRAGSPWVTLALLVVLSGGLAVEAVRLPSLLLWCPAFVAGALLARQHDGLCRWLRACPPRVWWGMLALGVVLYGNRYGLPLPLSTVASDLLTMAGSVVLILVST